MSLTFILDSFVLAVLGFCISLSMGKPIAAMFDYELDATGELFSEVKTYYLPFILFQWRNTYTIFLYNGFILLSLGHF